MTNRTIKGKQSETLSTKRPKKIERQTQKIQVEKQKKRIVTKAKTKGI